MTDRHPATDPSAGVTLWLVPKCPRCGIEKRAGGRVTLCRTCKDVLTREEWQSWAA